MTVQNNITSTVFADSKPHYQLLDGLRGVAALFVIWYHVFEGYQFVSGAPVINYPNHGYLAVDFFFLLSGFVVSYAYDDRMGRSMSRSDFFKRRLIRLHPMVVMGSLFGAVTFIMQGSVRWDGSNVSFAAVLAALLCAVFFVPAIPGTGMDVRGNGEMFPLNGPSWSLFFEYIGNVVYALLVCRMSTRLLAWTTLLLGLCLGVYTLADCSGAGCLSVGWSLGSWGFAGGVLRMLFPFSLGMLLRRSFKPITVGGAFWLCSVVLMLLFSVPYIPGLLNVNCNGLFELVCIALLFPSLVWLGASGKTTDRLSSGVCRFLGDISFPLYIIHYPFYYLFYAWLAESGNHTFASTWQVVVVLMSGSVLLAYFCLKIYDEPLRKRLAERFLKKCGN